MKGESQGTGCAVMWVFRLVTISIVVGSAWGARADDVSDCQASDAKACGRASDALVEGRDRTRDGGKDLATLERAEPLAAKGCEMGDGRSCGVLSRIFAVRESFDKALQPATKGCEMGDGLGCSILAGILAQQGELDGALPYAVKGCDLGDGFGCSVLAVILAQQDKLDEAIPYAIKGCDLGDGRACGNAAGILIQQGRYDEALPHAIRGCELGDGGACGNAAGILGKQGKSDEVLRYAIKGCELGHGYSCGTAAGILGMEGRHDEALPYAIKGCELEHGGACGNAAKILGKPGKLDEALPYAIKGCDLGDGGACGNAAAFLGERGKYDEALPYAVKGCELGDGGACGNAAAFLGMQGKYDEALPHAVKGCELGDGGACGNAAAFLGMQGKYDEALPHAAKGCELGNGNSCRNAAWILSQQGKHDESLPHAIKGCELGNGSACGNAAWILFRQGTLDESLQYAVKGCELGDGGACGNAAAGLIEQGQHDEALPYAVKGCELGDGNSCRNAAWILGTQGKQDEVPPYEFKGCELGDGGACGNAAASFAMQRKLDEALPYAIKGCELGDGNSCGNAAWVFAERGRFGEALPYAVKGCELGNGLACGNAAGVLGMQGKWDQALPHAAKGCELGDGRACGNRAVSLRQQGRYDEALPYVVKGCELGDGGACGNAAAFLGEQGKLDESLPYAVKGCELGDGNSCGNAAWVFAEQGKFGEALPYAAKGCELGDGRTCGMAARYECSHHITFNPDGSTVPRTQGATSEECARYSRLACQRGGFCEHAGLIAGGLDLRKERLLHTLRNEDVQGAVPLYVRDGLPEDFRLRDIAGVYLACVSDDRSSCAAVVEGLGREAGEDGVWKRGAAAHFQARQALRLASRTREWRPGEVVGGLRGAEETYRSSGLGYQAYVARLDRGFALWLAGDWEESLDAFAGAAELRADTSGLGDEEREWIGAMTPAPVWGPMVGKGLSLARLGRGMAGLVACGQGADVWTWFCRAVNHASLKEMEEAGKAFEETVRLINEEMTLWSDRPERQEGLASYYGVVLDAYLDFLLGGGVGLEQAGRRGMWAIEVWKARNLLTEVLLRQVAVSAGEGERWLSLVTARAKVSEAAQRGGGTGFEELMARRGLQEARDALSKSLGGRLDFGVPSDLSEKLCESLPEGGVLLNFAPRGFPLASGLVVAGVRKREGRCEAGLWEAGAWSRVEPEGEGLLARSPIGGPSGYEHYADLLARRMNDLGDAEWDEVGRDVFGGVLAWVRGGGSVLAYVPYGPLERVNLEYLHGDWLGKGKHEPLGKAWRVVRLVSASLAARSAAQGGKRGPARRRVLSYVNPDYSLPLVNKEARPESGVVAAEPSSMADPRATEVALEQASLEAARKGLLGAVTLWSGGRCPRGYESLRLIPPIPEYGDGVETRAGRDASEGRLREDLAHGASERYWILHFLTHGVFKPSDCVQVRGPESGLFRSVLALAGANAGCEGGDCDPNDDGELSAAEVLGLSVEGVDVVVLAACQSGVGAEFGWAGTLGFPQAFLRAGARYVLATLRSVPGKETSDIVAPFYEYLKKGIPPDEALVKARDDYRSRHPAHPLAGMDLVLYKVRP